MDPNTQQPPAPATPAPETVPTVDDAARRPVVLPEQIEEERVQRSIARLVGGPPEPPATPPPAEAPPAPAAAASAPTPPAEPPAPAQPPAGPADFAQAIAQLTARQQELLEQQRQVEERAARLKRYEDFEATLMQKDALGALQQLGVNFDDLARAAVDGRGVETTTKVEKQLADIQAKIEAFEQKERAAERAQLEAQAHREIEEGIAAQSPLLKVYGDLARDAVRRHIEEVWTSSGGKIIVPLQQAISKVESDFSALVNKALADESVRGRFLTTPNPATSGPSEQPARVTSGHPTTITNGHATEPPRRSGTDVLSEEERKARALRHLK